MRMFGSKSVLDNQGRVRGAGMIGLLVVVVIIMILMVFFSPLSKDDQSRVSRAQGYQDRAKDVTCKMNIDNVRTRLTQMQLSNPGMVITPLILEKKGILPPCPDHGEYVVENGQVYCTKHNPPPSALAGAAATSSTAAATTTAH